MIITTITGIASITWIGVGTGIFTVFTVSTFTAVPAISAIASATSGRPCPMFATSAPDEPSSQRRPPAS